jgi:hypothetical protein
MGRVVGAFPADMGERCIHFFYEFCDMRTWFILFGLTLWMAAGAALLGYCMVSTSAPTVASILTLKTSSPALVLGVTDQAALLSIPAAETIFFPIMLALSWARVNSLGQICENFVTNGYRVGTAPERRTMSMFWVRVACFLPGQTLMNIHLASIYCDDSTKQALLSVLLVLWQLPLYLAIIFLGFVQLQLVQTLTEYFKHLRSDVLYKNESLARHGHDMDAYDKLVKIGGLPKRLDRLIEEIRHIQAVYGPALFYDFSLHLFMLVMCVYMALALGVNSAKSGTSGSAPPWWLLGYVLLALHHYLRIAMFCHAGEHLRRELVKALSLISQFGYVHSDPTLLSLCIARKPDRLLTVAGYAPLDRTTLGRVLAVTLLAVMLLGNFKLSET